VSENAITIVELSAIGPVARERAAAARDWLLEAGVIVPNADRDDLWQPSEFAGGPRAATAFPDHRESAAQLGVLGNSGVDIVTERQVFHSVENYEPPACPSCGTPIDEEDHHDLIDGWLAGEEPSVRCPACGTTSLIGDWPGEWTFQVGELAVAFNNWPPLSAEFLASLGGLLGPRWRVVYEHT
jgi:hypothetical protein